MKKDILIYTDNYGDDNEVAVVLDMYRDNDNLFVGLEEYDEELDLWDSYCHVTVNVGKLPFLESAINMKYGGQEKIQFLVQNGFGVLTDKKLRSGGEVYPVFRFNEEKLKELAPELFEKYAKAHESEVVSPFSLNAKISAANQVKRDLNSKSRTMDKASVNKDER